MITLLEAIHGVEEIVAERERLEPEGRGLDAPVPHHRHRAAERLGELAQHARHRRLRERELLGRARDAAQAHAGLERHELGKETVTEELS